MHPCVRAPGAHWQQLWWDMLGAYQPLATLFSVVEVHLQLRVTDTIKFCSQL